MLSLTLLQQAVRESQAAEEPRASQEVAHSDRAAIEMHADVPAESSLGAAVPGPGALDDPDGYEIVLGRRQVASLSFVAVVLLVIVSAIAYVAGKSMAADSAPMVTVAKVSGTASNGTSLNGAATETTANGSSPAASNSSASTTLTPAAPAAVPTPILEATIAPPAAARSALPQVAQIASRKVSGPVDDAPLFADPQTDAVYVQIGAVEQGIAVLLAEGIRSHGLRSIVAPGPSAKTFRVLIGPLPNAAAMTRAKETVDLLGLATFARTYKK